MVGDEGRPDKNTIMGGRLWSRRQVSSPEAPREERPREPEGAAIPGPQHGLTVADLDRYRGSLVLRASLRASRYS